MSSQAKTPRNSPCPCGSGKKHKVCCMGKQQRESAKVPLGASMAVFGLSVVGFGLLLNYKDTGSALASLAAGVIGAGLLYVLRDPNPPRGGGGSDASSINFGR